MKIQKLTKDDLIAIHNGRSQGYSYVKIASLTNLNHPAVYYAGKTLEAILAGRKMPYGKTYREAVKAIKQQGIAKEPAAATPSIETSAMQRLELAFANMQEAMADVIVEEVETRSREAVAAKERELAEQKEEYEQKLLKLQAIVAEAKDSSILGVIQRKWGQQPSRT